MKAQAKMALKSYFVVTKKKKKKKKNADKLYIKFSSTSNTVYELEPKKRVFCSGG